MEEPVRVGVVFEDRHLLTKPQRSEGLRHSWLLLRPGLRTISDVASHITRSFDLRRSCPVGIVLSMGDFVLPAFESTAIFKDKDIIRVRKKGHKPRDVIKNRNDANAIEDANVVEKQPLLLCDKLLSDEELKQECEGYQSEEEEDADDQPEEPNDLNDTLCQSASPKRKRKHSNNLQSPKRKKRKTSSPEELTVTPVEGTEIIQIEKTDSFPLKEVICEENHVQKNDRSLNRLGRKVPGSDANGSVKDVDDSVPTEERSNQINKRFEPNGSKPHVDGGAKKFPSRSARRKKARRIWLRQQALSEKKEEGQNIESGPVNNLVQNCLLEKERHQKSSECKTLVQNADGEGEVVPIVVRPGHIRFEPLDDAEPSNQQKPEQAVAFQWNGTTSKKKGQKWGRERTFTSRVDNKSVTGERSNEKYNNEEKEVVPSSIDFEKLVPLTRLPKEGEVVAYRLVELSSSWCPEISSFRVGIVSHFDPASMTAILVPVPGHPIPTNKTDEESTEENLSLYKEDGSLEIEFTSLIDPRLVGSNISNGTSASMGRNQLSEAGPSGKWDSGSGGNSNHAIKETTAPTSEKKKGKGWDEIDQALSEKKAELQQKDGWGDWTEKENSRNTSWSFRALRRSALGPTMSLLRAGKHL